jgi:hypothetical protein
MDRRKQHPKRECMDKLLFSKLLLLLVNVALIGFAITLIILALAHSHSTNLLSNAYSSGNIQLPIACVSAFAPPCVHRSLSKYC